MDALTPQQEALRTVRDRYERGAIEYDTFRDAFEKLLKTEDPAECQHILDDLPTQAPVDVLAALDRTAVSAVPVRPAGPTLPQRRRMFTLMGEINRTRHPWKMAEHTSGVALMGEINLDLTMAALPERGVLRVSLLMGEVRIIVPDNVSVTVHAFTFMGETRALNEHAAGIFAVAHDDDERDAPHHLDIHVFCLMGEIRIQRSGTKNTLPARARNQGDSIHGPEHV